MDGQAEILARHWRRHRGGACFDPRKFDDLANLVVSVRQRALERRLSFLEWATEQWVLQCGRGSGAA